jgi:hypothetical protein
LNPRSYKVERPINLEANAIYNRAERNWFTKRQTIEEWKTEYLQYVVYNEIFSPYKYTTLTTVIQFERTLENIFCIVLLSMSMTQYFTITDYTQLQKDARNFKLYV